MAMSGGGSRGRRWWRRFRRRPVTVQAGIVTLVIVVVAAGVFGIARHTSAGGRTTTPTTNEPASGQVTAPDEASTSTRGVVGNTINVVFPVVNLSELSDLEGFAGDPEDAQQINAIDFYVNQINKAGGINGRKIHALTPSYDPTDEAGMRALCKDWTEGNPPVFAVVDGLGAWNGDNE